jgi:alpha-tubulin suppressor-like RCC1 family protein
VCLTANGELFTWGSNVCGQLGRTQGDGWGYPQLVPALMGMRMSQVKLRVTRHTSHVTRHTSHVTRHQIGCGGAFTVALSEHGVTYAWGR